MKIMQVISGVDLQTGGPSRVVIDLSEALAERGHKISICTQNIKDIPTAWREYKVDRQPIYKIIRGSIIGIWGSKFKRSIEHEILGCDVIHIHGLWEPYSARIAFIAHNLNIPYVITLHGMLDDWCMKQKRIKKLMFLLLFGKKMLKYAAVVHCTATDELRQCEKWLRSKNGLVIPNIINLSLFTKLPGPSLALDKFEFLKSKKYKLLFLSRIDKKKGIEYLIKAVKILLNNGLDIGVVVAGMGTPKYLKSLRKEIDLLGITDKFCFVGQVNGITKVSLLQAADLLVIPTSQENFGLVFFESFAAGLPVVTTNLVDTQTEILESGAGWTLPQNPEVFANVIEKLLLNKNQLVMRGLSARKWLFSKYSINSIINSMEMLYKKSHSSKS